MAELTLFGIGVVIVLLFILIARVSAIKKTLNALNMKLNPPVAAAREAVNVPKSKPASSAAGPKAVPNEVIAAIGAAVNQYCIENT